MRNIYIRTITTLIISYIITVIFTQFVFYPEAPETRPYFKKIFDRLISPIVGSKGEPIRPGVDPTPPPSIYY